MVHANTGKKIHCVEFVVSKISYQYLKIFALDTFNLFDSDDYDCTPEKLKKCNIICEKNKTVEKRACNCKEEEYKVECAQKRGVKCDVKKKCPKHVHAAAKRCKSAAGKKKSCCSKKKSPLMQRFFKFPAIMIAPIRGYNGPDTGAMSKKGQKRCGCGCGCGCCCCEPCCCCCHECCCPCCCCCEPCCCCDCCHHCCHCCHCPCCCGCGGCKKSKAAPAKPPAIAAHPQGK